MASPDADSLFTNIPLDKTIDICIDNLYNSDKNPLTFSNMIFITCLRIIFYFMLLSCHLRVSEWIYTL